MEDINTEVLRISRINSAGLINIRLNNLWEDAHENARDGKFLAWNGDLDRIWCELAGDVKEGKEEDNKFKEINEKLAKKNPLINWDFQPSTKKIIKEVQTKKKDQYDLLMTKEIFLRRLQNSQGKGTAYETDFDDYMKG